MSEQMDAVKNWGDIAAKLQRENFELRQALEASRAETREARRLLVRWFYGKPPKHGERPLIDDVAAFLAGPGRGGSPTGRGTEPSTGARSLEAAMGETKPCDVPVCEWEAAYRQVIGLVRDWANEQVKEDGPDLTPAERKLILLVLSYDKDPRLPAAVIAVGMPDARSAASPAPGVPETLSPTGRHHWEALPGTGWQCSCGSLRRMYGTTEQTNSFEYRTPPARNWTSNEPPCGAGATPRKETASP